MMEEEEEIRKVVLIALDLREKELKKLSKKQLISKLLGLEEHTSALGTYSEAVRILELEEEKNDGK